MSTLLSNIEFSKPTLADETRWLWIAVYEHGGTPHNDETQHHWAYVLGTKQEVLKRAGIRFNVWKCHRLNLHPQSKLEYLNQIFEPENSRSTLGGCHTHRILSFTQLAEVWDEQAPKLHLLAHAVPDADSTNAWTRFDWVRSMYDDLKSDKAIMPHPNQERARFVDIVWTKCFEPGFTAYKPK